MDLTLFSEMCSTLQMMRTDDALLKLLSMHLLGMLTTRICRFLAGFKNTDQDLKAGDDELSARAESRVDIHEIMNSLKDIGDACEVSFHFSLI